MTGYDKPEQLGLCCKRVLGKCESLQPQDVLERLVERYARISVDGPHTHTHTHTHTQTHTRTHKRQISQNKAKRIVRA